MALFGRKGLVQQPDRGSGGPDTLDVNDSADVKWIKQSNDPLVWHDAALACLIFRGDQHGLVPWLARQARLDRVTAAAMFLHRNNGVSYLQGSHVEFVEMMEAQVVDMIETLCDLDGTRTLADNGIGMEAGWESARLEAIEVLGNHPRVPMQILGGPLDRQTARMPYSDMGEGDLMSDKHMRETMPFLFD